MISPVGISWILSSIIVLFSPVSSYLLLSDPVFCCTHYSSPIVFKNVKLRILFFRCVPEARQKENVPGRLSSGMTEKQKSNCQRSLHSSQKHQSIWQMSPFISVTSETSSLPVREILPPDTRIINQVFSSCGVELCSWGVTCWERRVSVRPASTHCLQRMLPLWLRDRGEDMELSLSRDGCHM